MSVYKYKKYKISLQSDSKKTQGLRTGDIVRRQYFDGKNLIYSLMCVLDYGIDKTVDSNTNDIVEKQYFIGALLEGDVPKTEEILDFARITNLFDINRSGAIYLTGSDDNAPYMDVIVCNLYCQSVVIEVVSSPSVLVPSWYSNETLQLTALLALILYEIRTRLGF